MYSVIGPDGHMYGPVELHTLKAWCQEGRITSDTIIVDPIDGVTKRACDLPEVAQHIRPPAAPTAVPTPSRPSLNAAAHHPYPTFTYQHPASYLTPPKSKLTAILLAFLLGALGIHRFYLGHIGVGIAMLLITVLSLGSLAIITGIWALVDLILIASGSLRDNYNRPLTWP